MHDKPEYGISCVEYDFEKIRTVRLGRHLLSRDGSGKREIVTRATVIAEIVYGMSKYYTLVASGQNRLRIGTTIQVVHADAQRFIRSDKNIVTSDYLNNVSRCP